MAEVSVIVPVYKAEKYLRRCVDSILAQTFTDFELILVDDGSPDTCGTICDEYAQKDSRVIVIHKENGGVSSARNAALDIARGECIAFADSDDVVSDEYLAELMRWKEFDYVTAGFSWQDKQGCWHVREFEEVSVSVDIIRTMPSKYLGKYYFGSPWATLMKRSVVENNMIRFDTSIHSGEDTLFIMDYLKCVSSVKTVRLCGYRYHYYPASLVNKVHRDFWKWKIVVEQSIVSFFHGVNKEEYGFLLNREFEVLTNLVAEYDQMGLADELFPIYKNPFFRSCTEYKSKNGSVLEKLFCYSMERDNYTLYKRWCGCLSVLTYVKTKLKRIPLNR